MTETYEYTAYDLAVYPLCRAAKHPEPLATFLEEAYWEVDVDEVKVAQVIIDTCAVGYGGHYGEVLEDCQEGEIMACLAEYLAPTYNIDSTQAYYLLTLIRDEWTSRMRAEHFNQFKKWKDQGFAVLALPIRADNCPACGKLITDVDEEGCEAPDGQRWCVQHALDVLSYLWGNR